MELRVDPEMQLRPQLWAELVRFIAEYRCAVCGKERSLDAHHKNEDREDNRLANGECLCRSCHKKFHHAAHKPGECAWCDNNRYGNRRSPSSVAKMKATLAREDKTPVFCPDCSEGPFKGPRALATHRAWKHSD